MTGLTGYPRCLLATGDTGGRSSLAPAEIARLRRLKDAARRRDLEASLQARRILVAGLTGCEPEQVVFSAAEDGAPILKSPQGYSVSIANKSRHTLLALSPAPNAIGADIEVIREINWRAMLAMVCDAEEGNAFVRDHATEADALPDFFRLWTVKEAILKATGAGFRAGPKNIRVPSDLYAEVAMAPVAAFGERFDVWVVRMGDLAFSLTRKTA